jgi:hypothetical protein
MGLTTFTFRTEFTEKQAKNTLNMFMLRWFGENKMLSGTSSTNMFIAQYG